MMFLIAKLGGWLSGKLLGELGGRITENRADAISAWLLALVGLLILGGALYLGVNAIRNDARNDLLRDQAEERRAALEAQRIRESAAAAARAGELAAGAAADAEQQKELTDATKDLPDSRPSDRARRRVCVELQQQDRAAGRPPRPC
ncbi:hypothetical protein [Sphingopyxis sp. QXT-31]|uniref:hypothetical protein n=1 Tax=Sphingopyxis sp. QXT-31 TaxID=1357916 RepID=UPI0012EBEEC8|nr:hypothetical protein [Sphingopyxis sp. QXT-31]